MPTPLRAIHVRTLTLGGGTKMLIAKGAISVLDEVPCYICKAPSATMATRDGEYGVEWCENGHLVAVDYHGKGYQQVYDFTTHS